MPRPTVVELTAAVVCGVVLAAAGLAAKGLAAVGLTAIIAAPPLRAWFGGQDHRDAVAGLAVRGGVLLAWATVGALRLLVAAEPAGESERVLTRLAGEVAGPIRRVTVPPSETLYGVADDRTEFTLQPSVGAPVAVSLAGHLPRLAVGHRVHATGMLLRRPAAGNPGERLRSSAAVEDRRTLYVAHPSAVTIADDGPRPLRLRESIRVGLTARLRERLPPQASATARAVLLGDRSALDRDTVDRFRRTGLSHLLAISGLHVGMIALVLLAPLGRLPVSQRTRAAIFIGLMVGYALLVQPALPIYRAVACVSLLAIGGLSAHSRVRFAHLALVLLGFLAVDPRTLFSPGLQLSFLATAAILAIQQNGILDRLTPQTLRDDGLLAPWWQRPGQAFWRTVLWSGLLWTATAPVVMWHFRWLTPIGVLMNILCLPLMTLLIATLLVAIVTDVWAPPLATPLWSVADGIVELLLGSLGLVGRSPGLLHVAQPPLAAVVIGYGLVAGLLFGSRPRLFMRLLAVGMAVLTAWTVWPSSSAATRVHVFDVGHGLAVLVQSDDRSVLFDAGSLATPRQTTDRLSDALRSCGVGRLDAVVISHADVDHFSAVPGLLAEFPVAAVLVHQTFLDVDSRPHEEVIRAIGSRQIPFRLLAAGDRVPIGAATVVVEHPVRGERFDADNANSLVCRVEAGGGSVLLPGDLEGEGQEFFLLTQPRPVDVLVAPHHGSRHSNTPALRAALDPQAVVISDSRPAHNEVAAVYEGALLLEQSRHGAVTISLPEGGPVQITTFRTRRTWQIAPAAE